MLSPKVLGIAIARYDFCARDMRELSLLKGDMVKIYTKMSANGWWRGEVNGRVSCPRECVGSSWIKGWTVTGIYRMVYISFLEPGCQRLGHAFHCSLKRVGNNVRAKSWLASGKNWKVFQGFLEAKCQGMQFIYLVHQTFLKLLLSLGKKGIEYLCNTSCPTAEVRIMVLSAILP